MGKGEWLPEVVTVRWGNGTEVIKIFLERFRTSIKYQARPATADIAFYVAAYANGIISLTPRYSVEYRILAYDDRSSNSAHEPTSGSWPHFCLPMLFAEPAQSDTLVDQTIETMRPCFVPNCGEPPHNVVPVAEILSKA
jgi:hypothetical protein